METEKDQNKNDEQFWKEEIRNHWKVLFLCGVVIVFLAIIAVNVLLCILSFFESSASCASGHSASPQSMSFSLSVSLCLIYFINFYWLKINFNLWKYNFKFFGLFFREE